MSNREKILTGILIVLIAVYSSGVFTGGGYLERVKKLKDEYTNSNDAYDDIIRMTESLNEYEKELKSMQAEANAISRDALNPPDAVQVIEKLYSCGSQCGFEVVKLEMSDILRHEDGEDEKQCGITFIEANVYVEGKYKDAVKFAQSIKAQSLKTALMEAELSDDGRGSFSGYLIFRFYGAAESLEGEANEL